MKIVECVPNISEGKRPEVYNEVAQAAAAVAGVELLDVDPGIETNRTVITFVGEPEAVLEGAFQLVVKARGLIDMRDHHGAHGQAQGVAQSTFGLVGQAAQAHHLHPNGRNAPCIGNREKFFDKA